MAYATKEQLTSIIEDMASKINAAGGGGGTVADRTGAPCYSATPRWLRFNPNNKKGVIIKANTSIMKPNGKYAAWTEDTAIDLSEYLLEGGKEYFLYITDTAKIIASTAPNNTYNKIGRLHTLCANVGDNVTMIAPASPNSGIVAGDSFLVKSYDQNTDPDFYNLYNKEVTGNSTNADHYDVITCGHPLSGFLAGDILPESVFCLSFHPECLVEDAMVYDKDTDSAIDIYLQSGTAQNTRSEYGAVHTVNRNPWNHQEDFRAVGKKLLADHQFTSAALGSNERTNIAGSTDVSVVGGHSDTSNRRMISAIGCEEMCGYLWQWLDEIAPVGGSSWQDADGRSSFGPNYGTPYVVCAGGGWDGGADCGSRSRGAGSGRSARSAACGGRGSSRVSRIA